ncbi:lysosomal protein NCU-G1 [Platysternon megacephalum]|uniref:Lysosomal protein NCU-G1 n=1 Tax=Platysternon megacephalum TaxID=55544 RepID=A0A4D9ENG6_9SAUR|nr:lysosomal protein NCU-G1 [Platysternon megacephalum]
MIPPPCVVLKRVVLLHMLGINVPCTCMHTLHLPYTVHAQAGWSSVAAGGERESRTQRCKSGSWETQDWAREQVGPGVIGPGLGVAIPGERDTNHWDPTSQPGASCPLQPAAW